MYMAVTIKDTFKIPLGCVERLIQSSMSACIMQDIIIKYREWCDYYRFKNTKKKKKICVSFPTWWRKEESSSTCFRRRLAFYVKGLLIAKTNIENDWEVIEGQEKELFSISRNRYTFDANNTLARTRKKKGDLNVVNEQQKLFHLQLIKLQLFAS